MMRTLHKDIRTYNLQYEAIAGGGLSEEEAQEETGWKLVHADVFRPPRSTSTKSNVADRQ